MSHTHNKLSWDERVKIKNCLSHFKWKFLKYDVATLTANDHVVYVELGSIT